MPTFDELTDKECLAAIHQRRRIIDGLLAVGYTRYDMTPSGDERFRGRGVNNIRTVCFDRESGQYVVK